MSQAWYYINSLTVTWWCTCRTRCTYHWSGFNFKVCCLFCGTASFWEGGFKLLKPRDLMHFLWLLTGYLTLRGLVTPVWQHRFSSTLVQVTACWLMAPNHNMNQNWHLINKALWYLPESNCTVSGLATIMYDIGLKNTEQYNHNLLDITITTSCSTTSWHQSDLGIN